jgi:hypothetical protein
LYFEFEGKKVDVIEICKRYLDYLERLVQAFIEDHKETASGRFLPHLGRGIRHCMTPAAGYIHCNRTR